VRHPRYVGVDGTHSEFDIAVIELATAAPAAARRYPIYYGALAPGIPIVLAGYGASGPGSKGPTVAPAANVKRVGANVIARLLPAVPAVAGTVEAANANAMPGAYLFVFRSPDEHSPRRTGSLGNSIETGLASGDSGSPAFVGRPQDLRLMGINSFIARSAGSEAAPAGYGTLGGGCVVGRHLRWIWKIMAEVSQPG